MECEGTWFVEMLKRERMKEKSETDKLRRRVKEELVKTMKEMLAQPEELEMELRLKVKRSGR